MATLSEIANRMREMNTPYLKVYDLRNNILYRIDGGETGVEEAIQKLSNLESFLSPYGKVNIVAATPAINKQNFKDAFKWDITFQHQANNNLPVHQNFMPMNMPGMISLREAELISENNKLKADQEWNKRFDALEKKFDEKNKESWIDQLGQVLPLAGLVFKIDQEKIDNIMKLGALSNMMNGKQGIAGPEQKNNITVEGTEEEKIKQVENLLGELSKKLPIDKIIILLKAVNSNPALADAAIAIINQPKT